MPLTADIDGTDITDLCQRITWSPAFNLIDTGVVRIPSGHVEYQEGISQLHLYSAGEIKFSGPIWNPQAEGGVDSSYTEITAHDHRIYMTKRLCKSTIGDNLITPGDVILTNVTAPEIMAQYLENSLLIDGDLPLGAEAVDSGGADCTGVPTDFPMTLDRMRSLLVSSGQLDQVLHPGVDFSTVDFLNHYENDLSGSVIFEYATGAHNCQVATRSFDMEDLINALWYLLGPRLNEEHWRGSITPTAPHPGGHWPPALLARIMNSRALYYYMQEIRIFDDKGDENSIRPLFEEEWSNEAWVRAVPREFASVRPERGLAPTFSVGDQIGVEAGALLDGGFSGKQTVYSFTWSTDADGVDEIEELSTSADQEGATGA